ncbi:nucleoside phosphorylase [Nostoc sp. NIES-2111]
MSQLPENTPLLAHPLAEEPVFTAKKLMESVRSLRKLDEQAAPQLCFLEFDGDLTDWLVAQGKAHEDPAWACFHTKMYCLELAGLRCGVIPRTIGGPYAVLVAEQLVAAGCRWIVGLTSAGRVDPKLPLPCMVLASGAVRDEGTSLHYLPPGRLVHCPVSLDEGWVEELRTIGWAVRRGEVWTTDAPYRETQSQLQGWQQQGVLAVEMQAASLYAFGQAKGVKVLVIAMVSNAVDHEGEQIDTGSLGDGLKILEACARTVVKME